MKWTLPDVLAQLNQARATVADLPLQTSNAAQRATHVTELLRSLWTDAPLHVCLLRDGGPLRGAVRDRDGQERPAWLQEFLAAADTTAPATLPAQAGLDGYRLIWEAIGASHGGFGVAVPNDLPADQEALLHTLLQTSAALLATRLDLEEMERDLAAAQDLADFAEVGSPLAHEFNNFLNALLLHVAVLELKMIPQERQGLAEIRQQGKGMAALVQQWQGYHRRPTGDSQTADLNQAVRETVPAFGEAVCLELKPEPLSVAGSMADVKRVCRFLVRNAAAVSPLGEKVTVRTSRDGAKVFLSVADVGPVPGLEDPTELFDAYPPRRPGTNGLELAACKTIVRRLQGKISADTGEKQGVTVTVEWTAA